jgi:hypothetical protein
MAGESAPRRAVFRDENPPAPAAARPRRRRPEQPPRPLDVEAGERAAVIERKAALLERIAVEDGRPECAQQADEARAYAPVLRQGAQE